VEVGRRGYCSARHIVASPQAYSRASSDDFASEADEPNWHCTGPMNNGVSGVGRRPPTETALLPDYAALFTHERVVSVDLASKSCPARGDISQNLGFMLALR
jgi:hypothetical protein